jgi:hypothetical protein
MRLDHISYVASHDQISDVVNRIGSQIGTAFIDGGIHPKFGTRNFTAPLLNNQYIEVVCPLDHPATYSTPFGRAVKKKAEEGGGWMSWVIASTNIEAFEKVIGRKAVEGQRRKPDGTELKWKQLGVLGNIEDAQLPYFVQWLSINHPSSDGYPVSKIKSIEIYGSKEKVSQWISTPLDKIAGSELIQWQENSLSDRSTGINSVSFSHNGYELQII